MVDDDNDIDEKLLAQSLRTLVEQLPFDVWIRDANDRMIFRNAAALRRWGPSVAVGTSVGGAVGLAPTVADTWRATNARALAGETVKDEVVYDIEGVPHTFIGLVTAVHDETGLRGTVGINVDVTDERRARAEAHRLGQLLRDVFTSAPVAIGIRAVRGDELFHIEDNPFAAALLGTTPDALRGKGERELGVPAEQVARAIARFREAREAGGPVSFVLVLAAPDGTSRTFEGKAIAIEDPTEERYAFVAADVSELRHLQTGLIRADRLASLGTLSAALGHEIGTSTAVALGQIEIATRVFEQGAPTDDILVGLREAQRALLRVVAVLRDMRALALGATLGSETCEVASAVATVKDVLRHELERHVTLHESVPEGVSVAMSHSRLVQILLNLLRNAIEALGSQRGTLWIEVLREPPEGVRVDVIDDGPGLPEPLREKLFQPFVSTKSEGTGLGLYVCNLLARLSGGSLEALAPERGGVCMRLRLPEAD